MEDRTVVAYGCRKTKKLISGMEGENDQSIKGRDWLVQEIYRPGTAISNESNLLG